LCSTVFPYGDAVRVFTVPVFSVQIPRSRKVTMAEHSPLSKEVGRFKGIASHGGACSMKLRVDN
jgi:hypothetical protein